MCDICQVRRHISFGRRVEMEQSVVVDSGYTLCGHPPPFVESVRARGAADRRQVVDGALLVDG